MLIILDTIETKYNCSKSYLSLADAQRPNKSFRQQLLKNETSNFNYGESNRQIVCVCVCPDDPSGPKIKTLF